jgi:hypothetical protein
LESPDRALEEVSGRPETLSGAARERETEEGGGLRAASEAVAVVSAGALAGGGAGMLAGLGLGAINPFALGMVGVVVGTCASVFLSRLALKR